MYTATGKGRASLGVHKSRVQGILVIFRVRCQVSSVKSQVSSVKVKCQVSKSSAKCQVSSVKRQVSNIRLRILDKYWTPVWDNNFHRSPGRRRDEQTRFESPQPCCTSSYSSCRACLNATSVLHPSVRLVFRPISGCRDNLAIHWTIHWSCKQSCFLVGNATTLHHLMNYGTWPWCTSPTTDCSLAMQGSNQWEGATWLNTLSNSAWIMILHESWYCELGIPDFY